MGSCDSCLERDKKNLTNKKKRKKRKRGEGRELHHRARGGNIPWHWDNEVEDLSFTVHFGLCIVQ